MIHKKLQARPHLAPAGRFKQLLRVRVLAEGPLLETEKGFEHGSFLLLAVFVVVPVMFLVVVLARVALCPLGD